MAEPRAVLVIRLGALGDIVQSFGPFAAIRAQHAAARIVLLTTAPFAGFLARAPWFDEVRVDARAPWWRLSGIARLRRQVSGFDLVYDLQTSRRSTRYFWLAGRPDWSGIGAFRRFAHRDTARDRQHTLERQRGQLLLAGITQFAPPELGWAIGAAPPLARPYAMLVAGASPRRPEKIWPAARFGALAAEIAQRGVTPVVVGSFAEAPIAARICAACPQAVDLTGRTDLAGLAAVAEGASYAVGNDSGPMHLAAAFGVRCIVLFGGGSDPALTAPRGPDGGWATVLRAPRLADLELARVAAALP